MTEMNKVIEKVVALTRDRIDKTAKWIAGRVDVACSEGKVVFECPEDERRVGRAIGAMLSITLADAFDQRDIPFSDILEGIKETLDGVETPCPRCDSDEFDPGIGSCEACGFELF